MTETPSPIIEEGIAVAKARSTAARGRLVWSLLRLRDALMPGALARKLVSAVADKSIDAAKTGVETARTRPVAAIGLASLAALFLARKPIARALSSRKSRKRETPPPRTRSTTKRIRKAKP